MNKKCLKNLIDTELAFLYNAKDKLVINFLITICVLISLRTWKIFENSKLPTDNFY